MKKLICCFMFSLLLIFNININVKAEEINTNKDVNTEMIGEEWIIPNDNIAEGFCGDDAYWYLYEDGTLRITGTGYIWRRSQSKYPWYKYKDDITSVYIYKGIVNIPDYSFNEYHKIKSVKFEENSELSSIGEYAFCETAITEISIPEKVNEIGESCFEFCKELKDVTFLGNELTEIPYCGFYQASIESIIIPKSINTINEYAFYGCENLIKVQFEEGNELQKLGAMCFARTSIKNITIPKGVTELDDVFNDAIIEEIDFEDGSLCTTISEDCFYWNLSLKKIKMPDSLVEIQKEAFRYCNNLQEVDFSRCTNFQKICNGAFFSCFSLEKIVLPDTVNEIEELAFCDCRNLSEINIPSNLKTINKCVFYNCTNLKEMNIPTNIEIIEENAFEDCFNLVHVNITNNNTVIKNNAFLDCKNLELSKELYNRNKEAFIGCNIPSDNTNIDNNGTNNNNNVDNNNNTNNDATNNNNNNNNTGTNNKVPGTFDNNSIYIYMILLLISSISFKKIKNQ